MEETPIWVAEADGNTGKLPILENTDKAVICDTKILLQFAADLPVKGQGIKLWPNELNSRPGDISALMQKSLQQLEIDKFDKIVSEPYQLALQDGFKS